MTDFLVSIVKKNASVKIITLAILSLENANALQVFMVQHVTKVMSVMYVRILKRLYVLY